MSKAALYVVNNVAQEVAVNGLINPGVIVRKFGPGISLINNAIQLNEQGYYSLDVSITLAPTAEGEVTVSVFKDGVLIPGAIATETAAAAGDFINLSITALIREKMCCYFNEPSNLTFVLTGVDTNVTDIATKIIKL